MFFCFVFFGLPCSIEYGGPNVKEARVYDYRSSNPQDAGWIIEVAGIFDKFNIIFIHNGREKTTATI